MHNSVPNRSRELANNLYQPVGPEITPAVIDRETQCAQDEPLIPNQDSTRLLPQFPQLSWFPHPHLYTLQVCWALASSFPAAVPFAETVSLWILPVPWALGGKHPPTTELPLTLPPLQSLPFLAPAPAWLGVDVKPSNVDHSLPKSPPPAVSKLPQLWPIQSWACSHHCSPCCSNPSILLNSTLLQLSYAYFLLCRYAI